MNPPRYLRCGIVAILAVFVLTSCQTAKKGSRGKNRHASVGDRSFGAAANNTPAPPARGPLGRDTSYSKVATNAPVLALTFDDGPHPSNTPRLLDILRSKNVKATFFVTGENARKYPALLRRMISEGHEIGNHTMTHGKITKMSTSQIRQEIIGSAQAVHSATGVYPRSFRPPYGAITPEQKSWIKAEYGMPSILWSVDPEDWKKPGVNVVASRVINGANRGGILLLHDIHSTSIDATPPILDQLKGKGYQFLTISQLINLEGR
ncbi:MAG: polysaccharide deacetylase family protein [Verrucomicrobiales bacterium]|nr:polysaccharide deacetylase family protein [Verrucomicrobiales bacterium]